MKKNLIPSSKKKVPFDKSVTIKKLSLIITIVNQGQGELIMFMLSKMNVSGQFIQHGKGTASKDLYDILGVNDNRKEIVYSLVTSDKVEQIMKDLDTFFKTSRHKSGIAMSISLSSLAGITAYKFLSTTI